MHLSRPLLLVLACAIASPLLAAPDENKPVVATQRVEGEKLDSGLGDLAPYREWPYADVQVSTTSNRINPVIGEKLDSGLDEVLARMRATTTGSRTALR